MDFSEKMTGWVWLLVSCTWGSAPRPWAGVRTWPWPWPWAQIQHHWLRGEGCPAAPTGQLPGGEPWERAVTLAWLPWEAGGPVAPGEQVLRRN